MPTPLESKKVQVKRDRYSRYLIPDPVTGKERAWTRATTLAETLDDRFNLELWKLRTCAVGLAQRQDLLALVAAHRDDKKQLNKVCSDALEAGKASEGANLGIALHALTEQIDRGESPLILESLRADVDAYVSALAAHGFKIATLPDGRLAREVIVLCPELEVAGTADHILEHAGRLLIGDLKTGASAIEWGTTSIAIQLAIYAHATHSFDPATGELAELPHRDHKRAIVIHLPVGLGVCTPYEIDIEAGWEAAQQALWVRRWRNRKNLAQQLGTPQLSRPHDRRTWLIERTTALRAIPGAAELLQASWPAAVPGLKTNHQHTPAELDALNAAIATVEAEVGAAFTVGPERVVTGKGESEIAVEMVVDAFGGVVEIAGSGDVDTREPSSGTSAMSRPIETTVAASPGPVLDEGPAVDTAQIDEIDKRIAALDDTEREWIVRIGREMADAGMPLRLRANPTARRWRIAEALIRWAGHDDEVVRAGLQTIGVVGDAPIGALVAALDLTASRQFMDVAQALDAGHLKVHYRSDGSCELKQ